MKYFNKTQSGSARNAFSIPASNASRSDAGWADAGGFTIIETMISISVFLVVVMIGMDALLNASVVHQKTQDISSILDNLSFTMEDMSKNIRTGLNYHCVDDGNLTLTNAHSCFSGAGISFKSSADNTQWIYYIGTSSNGNYGIFKSVNGSTAVQLNTDEISLDAVSGFSVLGAEPPPDKQQPLVIIRLVGTIKYKNTFTPFSLQTSVSQRLLDK